MRLSRWRPRCPECGYLLRALAAPRCPECGEAFPTTARVYRRWANLRLRWERRRRGGFVAAYLSTIVAILITPWRAARGLSVPDLRSRAVRWAAAHLLAAALLATLFSWFGSFWYWGERWLGRPSLWPVSDVTDLPPAFLVLIWIGQTLVVWLMAVTAPVGVAFLLTELAAWDQPAGRWLARKWLAYAATVMPLVVGAWIATAALTAILSHRRATDIVIAIERCPAPPAWAIAAAYAYVWSAGMAASPYTRRRGVLAFVSALVLYAATWSLVRYGLFPPGTLVWWM